jgi:hypothetical protein
MEPGKDSAPWEGTMGLDSSFTYAVGARWLAFYGGDPESNGLAETPALAGPWKRIGCEPVTRHTENPSWRASKMGATLRSSMGALTTKGSGI